MLRFLIVALISIPVIVQAQTFLLPENGDALVGSISLTTSRHEDTISDLAWAYDQGFLEMRQANPKVDTWLPGDGTEIIVPGLYTLPDTPRQGIVINVPEMRMYYYPRPRAGGVAEVITYPISIGRQDWATPHGDTKIVTKIKDPSWTPPASIKREHAENGDILPDVVPAGPDNPLGAYAMRLGISGYLIHGTNKPYGLGMRVTHGCIRLYPKHIEQLYSAVSVGTPVKIINQPYKAGWSKGKLYLEVHPPLEEDKTNSQGNYQRLVNTISKASDTQALGSQNLTIDWNKIKRVAKEQSGIPVIVGQINLNEPVITEAALIPENEPPRSVPAREPGSDDKHKSSFPETYSDLF